MNNETRVYPYQRVLDEKPQIGDKRFSEYISPSNENKNPSRGKTFKFMHMSLSSWLLAAAALCLGSAEIREPLSFRNCFCRRRSYQMPKTFTPICGNGHGRQHFCQRDRVVTIHHFGGNGLEPFILQPPRRKIFPFGIARPGLCRSCHKQSYRLPFYGRNIRL